MRTQAWLLLFRLSASLGVWGAGVLAPAACIGALDGSQLVGPQPFKPRRHCRGDQLMFYDEVTRVPEVLLRAEALAREARLLL